MMRSPDTIPAPDNCTCRGADSDGGGNAEDALQDPDFHDACGYAWWAHDNRIAGRPLPFGCPTETEARQRYGE